MKEGFGNSMESARSSRTSLWFRRGVLAALGLLGLILYLFVFRPITSELAELEADLEQTHRQIAETGFGYPENPEAYLEDSRVKLGRMQLLADEMSGRGAFLPGLEELLAAPFRVLEFEQRRFDIRQKLLQLAEEGSSSLPVDLFGGLPSYYNTTERQQKLWLHLEFFNHVIEALLSSGGELRVERIESLPVRTLAGTSETEGSFFELQLRVKVSGPFSSLADFLNGALPEAVASGNSRIKKAYNIDRVDLQRVAKGDDGRVKLDARLTGFILSEQTL